MKKSLIALLLVVALVMTVSVFAVSAEETEAPRYASDLTVAADGASATGWCAHCQQERTDWQPLPLVSGHQTIAAGHWFLNADHTSGGAIRPSTNGGEHIIHLNGHTFTRTGATGALYPSVAGTKTFVMADTAEVGAFINSHANGQAVTQDGTGAAQELTLYSGRFISQATAAATASGSNNYEGGVVDLHTGANIFNMYGGTISGGKAYNGGAIFVKNTSAQVNIYGGTITNCSATNGGAIYCNPGRVTISGGTITNCTAVTGGAYWASGANAKLNITGGEISNCSTTNAAGAIYVQYQSANNTFSGGTIKNCSAPSGGAIYISGSGSPTITMSGTAKIESCSATKTGGAVQITGSAPAAPAHFNMQGGTISACSAVQGVGGVYNTHGVFTMSGGKIENCTAEAGAGASYRMNSGANCVFNMSGGEITGGESVVGGGNIAINVSATLNITGGKITNGVAPEGGNILFTAAPAAGSVIKGLEISGGTSTGFGGNVYAKAAVTLEDCEIIGGVAGTKVIDEETSSMVAPETDGRGGNVAITAASTLTNCVIRNGESYGAANPGGGNLYITANTTLDGCTITGGKAWNVGGNICLHGTPTVYVTGDSYIQGGTSYNNWGGNIGYTNAAKLYLQENTIVDGKDSYCRTGKNFGNNIGMSGAFGVAQELHVEDNAVVKNGDHTVNKVTTLSVAVCAATADKTPKIFLSGNGNVDKIILVGTTQEAVDGIVVLNEGYTGAASVHTGYADYNKSVAPGNDVHGALVLDGYTGTGSVKVLDNTSTGYITYVAEGALKVAPFTGFKTLNKGTENEIVVEYGLGDLSTAADYEYVKLYTNDDGLTENAGEITLTSSTPIDLNNKVVHFITNGYTLNAMDYRTDANVVAKYTKFTADDESKITLLTQNPINGYQYLNVKGEDGKWTSNRVTVELTKVSIRTTNAGIYYTTKIGTNDNAAAAMVDYGTAVTVADVEIDANFMEDSAILYTMNPLNETAAFTKTARSALVSGILSTEEGEDNNERANTVIKASSYVTAIVDGKEVKIMADEASELTYKDIVVKLDNAVHEWNVKQPTGYAANIATAVTFYNTWADVFSAWELPNLKAEAAKVA